MNQHIHAPEFPTDLPWLNTTHPLSLKELKGQVVVLDFWTYCCINCIHILPDLKWLEHRYAKEPLMVVGVHAAKFANERDTRNIESAIDRYQIEHPVVVDNRHAFWEAHAINSWPSFVVIDSEGYVRAKASGEGLRDALDGIIGDLLQEGREKGMLARAPLHVVPPRAKDERTLSFPGKLTMDPAGNRLFISDSNHHRILICTMNSPIEATLTQVVGSGEEGREDGDFGSASFRQPQGLCYLNDFLYICDTENHTLREVDLESESVLTIAGTGELRRVSDGYHPTEQQMGRLQKGDALEQALNSPWDVVAKGRSLFLAMAGSHQLCRYDLDKQTMDVFAGSGRENIVDGPRLEAQLAQPSGLSMQGDFLYFADSEVSAVRRVNLATDEVETLVGSGLFDFGHVDGPLKSARLQHALGLFATDKAVYIADTYNHAIRRIDLGRKQMETLVSRASQNACRIGEEACEVLPLFEPSGVWLNGSFLYIADTNNHLIRVFDFEAATLKTLEIR